VNHTPDTTAGNGGNFDPQQAAALLDQTTQQARRKLAPSPPWLLVTRAVMVLAACGAVWLSVRGQHPYRGPTAADIPILVAFIVINFGATVAVRERAIAGVRGRTRLRPAEITVLALAWAAAAGVMWALAAAGVSYSLYPTTVLIVPGLAWAAIMAARANWRACGTGLGVAAVGAAGAFAGPAGAWAVAGVGLCAVLLGNAAAIARRQRA
jgi:hypothetical protein